MNVSTISFIKSLENLGEGDLGLLRQHRGSPLDESLAGFDLFTGLWWPLRSKNKAAPRREIAWLIAKLYAEFRFGQKNMETLPHVMGNICRVLDPKKKKQAIARFDALLTLEVMRLEAPLATVLGILKSQRRDSLDWTALTDDLSIWERESKRKNWVNIFMKAYRSNKEESNVD